MKRIFIILAIAASIGAIDAQAQPKNAAAAKSAVEKAEAATLNAKQNTKTATWQKYGKALVDAYNFPTNSVWVGMTQQEYQLLGKVAGASESTVELNGRQFTVVSSPEKKLYFNERNQLEIIEVVGPVVDNALDKALDAYAKAAQYDAKSQKTKEIVAAIESIANHYSQDASTAYSLGDYAASSALFEKVVKAYSTAPVNKVDTMSIYNAGLTAWMGGNNDRAKEFYLKCLGYNYLGGEGEVYAKLAEFASAAGNKEEAKNYLETGFSAFPNSQGILIGLINYYIESGEDTNRLFSLLEDAKKNEPTNASLYYVEGNINLELGQPEEAVAAYRKCAEIDPTYAYGFIGEGIYFYNNAIDIQEKANNEFDDAKYMALVSEFEASLKSCIEPFEKAFELSNDVSVKSSIAEYLKNACFRFRTAGEEFQTKYEKYNSYIEANP